MPEHLEQVAAPAPEDKEMARVRVALEHLLDLERQPVHALTHVGAAGCEPHPYPTRDGDHPRTSTRSAAVTVAGSGVPEMRTRPPHGSSISIEPEEAGAPNETASAAGEGAEIFAGDVIVRAEKPGTAAGRAGRSAPTRSCLRQVKSWLVFTPYRRATPCTVPPAAIVSATKRRLSSSDQRRWAFPRKTSNRPIRPPQRPV